jgi:peptide/nickel transport system substrate-binding protein
MTAIMGDDRRMWRDAVGPFPTLSPLANDERRRPSPAPSTEAAQLPLLKAGFDGQEVTVLEPADAATNNVLSAVSADVLKRSGMNVELATSGGGPCCSALKPAAARTGWLERLCGGVRRARHS